MEQGLPILCGKVTTNNFAGKTAKLQFCLQNSVHMPCNIDTSDESIKATYVLQYFYEEIITKRCDKYSHSYLGKVNDQTKVTQFAVVLGADEDVLWFNVHVHQVVVVKVFHPLSTASHIPK